MHGAEHEAPRWLGAAGTAGLLSWLFKSLYFAIPGSIHRSRASRRLVDDHAVVRVDRDDHHDTDHDDIHHDTRHGDRHDDRHD